MTIPADQYELYAEFGLATEKAQVLEVDCGNIALSHMVLFFGKGNITDEHRRLYRNILDDCDRSTLGKLLRQVKSIGKFDDSILTAVDEALERRNYLMHHFFRTHNFGRKLMIEELKEIQAKLDLARTMLLGVSGTLEKLAGLDEVPDEIAKQLKKVQEEGKRINL
jgi:hypothetical protein